MQNTQSKRNIDLDDAAEKLSKAAENGDTELVRELLAKPGINNKADKYGPKPLYMAAYKGHDVVVQMLLKMPNINVNKTENNEFTPLYIAAYKGHIEVVKMLLTMPNIDVNKANNHGLTPLFGAAYKGHIEVVKMLLTMPNIDVNKANNHGHTPLYRVVGKGHDAVVKALIEKGAARINDKSKVTDKAILNMLAAQEYIDDLLSNKSIEPINLTEELTQMVLARAENRLESLFAAKDVVFDIARFEAILLSQKDMHPILGTILEKLHDLKESALTSDMEAAKAHFNLSVCADFSQLKYIWGVVEGKDSYLELLNTYKNHKKNVEARNNFNSLKEDFAAYLEQKKSFITKNEVDTFKVPEQFVEQVKSLFVQLLEIGNIGGSIDIEALSLEEQEALLFYSLYPYYQTPAILSQKVACEAPIADTNINIVTIKEEPDLAGDLTIVQD
jgi:hypothetical protein